MEGWQTFARAATQRFDDGAFEDVILIATAGLEQHPECGDLHEIRGVAHHVLGHWHVALRDLESATLLVPLGPQGSLTLAECYANLEKPDLADTILQFLAEPGRCPAPLLPDVARGLGRIGRFAAALAVCERITQKQPDYHPAWFGAAFYLLQLGAPASAAAEAMEAAYTLAPESATYRINLARMWMQTGRGTDAHRLIRDLPPEAVGCSCLARDLARIAEHAANHRLAASLLVRADELDARR